MLRLLLAHFWQNVEGLYLLSNPQKRTSPLSARKKAMLGNPIFSATISADRPWAKFSPGLIFFPPSPSLRPVAFSISSKGRLELETPIFSALLHGSSRNPRPAHYRGRIGQQGALFTLACGRVSKQVLEYRTRVPALSGVLTTLPPLLPP